MPIAATTAGLITTGASVSGGILSARGNRKAAREINDQQVAAHFEELGMQRQWNLEDWDRQNSYNSPKQQMQRLKEAGLNPALVYGNGADATSNAPVKQSSGATHNLNVPTYKNQLENLPAMLNQMYQLQMLEAQTDNLKAQADAANARAAADRAGIPLKGVETENRSFDLKLKQKLEPTSLEQADANLQATRANIMYTLDSNERAKLLSAMEIRKGNAEIKKVIQEIALSKQHVLESKQNVLRSMKQSELTDAEIKKIDSDILHLKAVIKNVNMETKLKKWQDEMYKMGMTPSDPAYFRAIIEALSF